MKRATQAFCEQSAQTFNERAFLPKGFSVRFCVIDDLEEILEIGRDSFSYNAPTKREIHYALTETHGGVFGLYDACALRLAGYMLLEAHAKHKNLYINTTVLRNEYRGRGLGQALYLFKDYFLNALGARNIWCHVAVDNAINIHLMTKNGFKILRTEEAYYDDGKAAVVMSKDNVNAKD